MKVSEKTAKGMFLLVIFPANRSYHPSSLYKYFCKLAEIKSWRYARIFHRPFINDSRFIVLQTVLKKGLWGTFFKCDSDTFISIEYIRYYDYIIYCN